MLSCPSQPTPDQLRSIQHVCKCKECYHPPHPPQTSCVASSMCASASPASPTPDQLRSIEHVCKCKEGYHPPPPTPDQLRSIQHVCKCKPPTPTPDQLRSVQHVCKCKECHHPPPPQVATKWGEIWKLAQKPTAFCQPCANYLLTGMILQAPTP